eukprot:Hpha_TRINITY_DN2030_c0_g1::TRINITY_DN2030_c0_g1_i1::g.83038::m.83038/K08825/DYRK1; dual specificity tyrosine-phosphorylation-regulated kinase 1
MAAHDPDPQRSGYHSDGWDSGSDRVSGSGSTETYEPPLPPRENNKRPCHKLGLQLLQTYKLINDTYFEEMRKDGPGPKYNDGYDDAQGNFIVKEGEEICKRYLVHTTIGKGSFGIVVRAYDNVRDRQVALKIVKNKPVFAKQAKLELELLLHMQKEAKDEDNIIVVLQACEFRHHVVLVFECLCINLFELLKCTKMVGLSLAACRKIAYQLLRTLDFLQRDTVGIIHCDLKPENVLLRNPKNSLIKVIDFGSACYAGKRMYQYIQTRFYRCPEVMLGLHYSYPIDVWSVGCILIEMHTASPVFDGKNELEQLHRIKQVLGPFPQEMLEAMPAERRTKYFADHKANELQPPPVMRRDKDFTSPMPLESILKISQGGPPGHQGRPGHTEEKYRIFLDFVSDMLRIDPNARIKPSQALSHSFIQLAIEEDDKVKDKEERKEPQPPPQHADPTAGVAAANDQGPPPSKTETAPSIREEAEAERKKKEEQEQESKGGPSRS